MGLPKGGVLMNLVLSAATSFACLTNQDYAPLVAKYLTGWTVFNAVFATLLPGKFKEAWGITGDNPLDTLLAKNVHQRLG
jgi:hypothetical protein